MGRRWASNTNVISVSLMLYVGCTGGEKQIGRQTIMMLRWWGLRPSAAPGIVDGRFPTLSDNVHCNEQSLLTSIESTSHSEG